MSSFIVGQKVITTHAIPKVPYNTIGIIESIVPFAHGTLIYIKDIGNKVYEINSIYVSEYKL